MKFIHIYALFLVLVCHASCVQNQTNVPKDDIRYNRTGLSESQLKEATASKMPVSMVRNVRQAKNGDILIASYLGVFRYDGTSFTNISSEINWPTFWDVLEDRKGNLWFASQDSGVYFYPSAPAGAGGKSFQHFTTKDGLGSNTALHIYEDRAGNIWFGATRYDPTAALRKGEKSFRNFSTKDGFPSNNIRLLLEDKTGKLWFGSQQEDMFVYDPSLNGEIGHGKAFTVFKNKDGKPFNNVWSIIEDKKGHIWLGDVDGLWRYDPSASPDSAFTRVSHKGAYAIIEDKKGNIWTTGSNGSAGQFLKDSSGRAVWALSRYDHKSLYNKEPTVTEIISGPPAFLGLLEANDGSIWFGGLGASTGVYRYDGKTITDFKSKEGQQ